MTDYDYDAWRADYYNDPYNSPKKFGLEIVGETDWSSGCYEFDLTVVWKDAEGNFYWDDDAGCSCPSPFENLHKVEQLNKGTWIEAINWIKSRAAEPYVYNANAGIELIEKIVKAHNG